MLFARFIEGEIQKTQRNLTATLFLIGTYRNCQLRFVVGERFDANGAVFFVSRSCLADCLTRVDAMVYDTNDFQFNQSLLDQGVSDLHQKPS